MTYSTRFIAVGLCAMLWHAIPAASAQQLNQQQIELIQTIAASICDTVKGAKGQKTDIQLQGDIDAKLKGLLSRFAELGGSTKGSLSHEEFEGPSREATATALEGDRSCRERVFDKMFDKLSKAEQGGAVIDNSGRIDDLEANRNKIIGNQWLLNNKGSIGKGQLNDNTLQTPNNPPPPNPRSDIESSGHSNLTVEDSTFAGNPSGSYSMHDANATIHGHLSVNGPRHFPDPTGELSNLSNNELRERTAALVIRIRKFQTEQTQAMMQATLPLRDEESYQATIRNTVAWLDQFQF